MKNLISKVTPIRISVRFEKAEMNLLQTVFSSAQISVYLFHPTQAIFKKVGRLSLKSIYENNVDNIATSIKMLCSLSFLLLREVEETFLDFEEQITYFEITFI